MGHTVGGYEIRAFRKPQKKGQPAQELILSTELGGDHEDLDLLKCLEAYAETIGPLEYSRRSRSIRCLRAVRDGDTVFMLMAVDLVGERTVMLDRTTYDVEYIASDGTKINRNYSFISVSRQPPAKSGLVCIHRPFGRNVPREKVQQFIARCVNAHPSSKARIELKARLSPADVAQVLRSQGAREVSYGAKRQFLFDTYSVEARESLSFRGKTSEKFLERFSNSLADHIDKGQELSDFYALREASTGLDEDDPELREFDQVRVSAGTNAGKVSFSLEDLEVRSTQVDKTAEFNEVYRFTEDFESVGSGTQTEAEEGRAIEIFEKGQKVMLNAAMDLGWQINPGQDRPDPDK